MNHDQFDQRVRTAGSIDEAAAVLSQLLVGGYSVGPNGRLYSIRQLVARLGALRIDIYAREHPPPHFHVQGPDVSAVFTIDNCTFLHGNIDGREQDLVYWWYQRARPQLVATWNATRPSDCPVGPVDE